MLHCPPSRINLANHDIAAFEQRSAAKQAAAKLARVNPDDPRLKPGPSHLARLNIVQVDDDVARRSPENSSSQAAICSDAEGEEERIDVHPPTTTWSPPVIRTSDYDDAATAAVRPINSAAKQESFQRAPPRATSPRQDGPTATQRQSSSPPALNGISERRLRPSRMHQTYQASWLPGPASSVAGSRIQPSSRHNFVLYEDPAHVQAHIEAQHMYWHAHHFSDVRGRLPQPVPQGNTRISPSRSGFAATATPVLLPNLNPGAPAFIPRTRFGSSTGGSEENNNGGARNPRQGGQRARISSTQSTSNLRIRSSFERNSQQAYFGRDGQGMSMAPSIPATRPAPQQNRRRSHTSDQNTLLPAISTAGERYPALRPPTSIPAPRRNSGSHRRVVFPRRSLRQDLVDIQRIDPPIRSNHDQSRSRRQPKTSSLAVPDVQNLLRTSSVAPSASSRSTPNLFRTASPAPLVHSRSSSLSWDRYVAQHTSGRRVPSMVSAASGISGSSDGGAHQSEHMPLEESMLSRGSPLDELLLDFGRFNMIPGDRPRSVGRSFQRTIGDQSRLSLLSGDIFRQEDNSHEQPEYPENVSTGRHPLRAANDSSFSEEDAVALSLALPSPNLPSSSPIASNSPRYSAPTTVQEPSNSNPRSPATHSHHSVSSIAPETQTTATPRVHIYDDRRSPRTQPQTPADISRFTRKARARAVTMSREEVGDVAGGLFSPVIPERRPHRPYTYPAGTPPSMVEGAAMPARTGIVGGQNGQQSSNVRREQRGGGGSMENDVEGNLAGLDADRRTWMERREGGSLDVTPPREGRFERYLR